ncbi:MAG TPA: NHL repeat-containing protein [Burkholderiales bacterium]
MNLSWVSFARRAAILALLPVALPALALQDAVFVRASDTSFSRPHDLALAPGGKVLYVADMGNSVVKALDPDSLRTLGVIGKGELAHPHDLCFDREGRLLVADTGNDRVAIYEVSGAQGRLAGEIRDGLGAPEGVAVGPDGRVYVTNTRLANLVVFAGGKKVAEVGGPGRGVANLSRPHDVEVDGAGNVYVVDSGNNRVVIFDRNLAVKRSLLGAPYNFNDPKYLFIAGDGTLYVADQHNHRIKIFGAGYLPLGVIGTESAGSGPGQFDRPEGVLADGERLWVADTYNDRIVLFRLLRK